MRYHVIGSEEQVRALEVAGVQGSVVDSASSACSALAAVLCDKSVGTVLVSSLYYDDPAVFDLIEKQNRKGVLPVVMRLSS